MGTTATNTPTVTRQHDQGGTFNTMVTAAITLIVGVLVFNQILGALPETSGGVNRTDIVGVIDSAFQLAPVVLIVLVAALVLAQVSGFGRS
jgi:hypothetical protein